MVKQSIVSWAKAAALLAHESVGQTRKYGFAHYGRERYYFHPCRVAELVATVTDKQHIIVAAALHDVLEDVSPKSEVFTPNWILEDFGPEVLFTVIECSNFYSKDVEQRRVLLAAIDLLWPPLHSRHDFPMRGVIDNFRKFALTAFHKADNSNREERKRLEALRYANISESAKTIKRADLFDNSLSMDSAPPEFVAKWMAEKAVAESLIGSWQQHEAEAVCESV